MDGFVSNKVSGVYRAIVVSNTDITHRGKIKIRIPSLHGIPEKSDSYVPDEDLPWATPACFLGVSVNSGQWIIPDVGTVVFVMFESGSIRYPIYLGNIPLSSNAYPIDDVPAGTDCTIKDLYNSLNDPTSDIIFKSKDGMELTAGRINGNIFLGVKQNNSILHGVLVNSSGVSIYVGGSVVPIGGTVASITTSDIDTILSS